MTRLKFSKLHGGASVAGEATGEPPRGLLARLTGCIVALLSPRCQRERAHLVARETCIAAIETLVVKEHQTQQKLDESEAKCLLEVKSGNSRAAMGHLRRKKLFAQQLEKVQRHKFSIESQLETLDESATNEGMVGVMRKVTKALRKTGKSVELVEDTIDDLNETLDDAADVSRVLQPQRGPTEDELEVELAELMLKDMPTLEPKTVRRTPAQPETINIKAVEAI